MSALSAAASRAQIGLLDLVIAALKENGINPYQPLSPDEVRAGPDPRATSVACIRRSPQRFIRASSCADCAMSQWQWVFAFVNARRCSTSPPVTA
ncbi:hypothetical protein PQR41_35685 [Paraburkholderia xenovorans]